MTLAVLAYPEPIGVAGRGVLGRQCNAASVAQLTALSWAQSRPNEVLGEIGRRGDPNESVDARRPGERREQHDPPAHARPHEDLPPFGHRIENGDRILCPAADRAERDIAARSTVAEIVESHIGVSAAAAI